MPWPINLKELDAIWNLGAQKISSISAVSVPCQKPPFASYVRRNERSKEACFERKQRNFDSDRQSCLNTQQSTSPFIDIRTFLDPDYIKKRWSSNTIYSFIFIYIYITLHIQFKSKLYNSDKKNSFSYFPMQLFLSDSIRFILIERFHRNLSNLW